MASQEEVLEAIKELNGNVSVKELKIYFGLENVKGSSWIPQRLNALEKREEIKRVLEDGKRRYILV
jgi:hypothetical protein